GENPTTSNGGSGQLPLGLVQIRNKQGQYTGTISITCDICHSGELQMLPSGQHFVSGMGANTADMQLLITDVSFPVPIGLNASRGVTNAEGLSGLLIGMLDLDSLGLRPEGALLSQVPGNTSGAGDTKMPAWWNASHRPRKFWDAGFSYDATRLDSAILNIGIPIMSPLGNNKAFNQQVRDKIERESYLIQAYVESLEAPVWPGKVDTALAEQGAILFHSKDLWGNGANPDIPRPASNGSCAGCHGVYSPRYVHDPAYLDDPRLEGIAGYIAPLAQIRTDKGRVRGFTKTLLENISSSWYSYPESSPGYIAPENKTFLEERLDDLKAYDGTRVKGACTWQGAKEDDVVGYLAPPLYGIWATAPYLHNGSVPDLWGVLDPDSRPAVWRRQLTQGPGDEHGYDTDRNAYDTERLGWKYEKLTCAVEGGVAYVSCDPEKAPPAMTSLVEFLNSFPASINTLGYQVLPPINRKAVEARKIFNTHLFGKKNTGHDFTRALNDQERRAIIEYLKTL
ncbi:MAG TPA: hypothetical protein VFM46_05300, partial [Pseudomonadales bacterium]|nr:hypothetical protein [Pseudomonadales bacterium]